jgi:hypothetical protein
MKALKIDHLNKERMIYSLAITMGVMWGLATLFFIGASVIKPVRAASSAPQVKKVSSYVYTGPTINVSPEISQLMKKFDSAGYETAAISETSSRMFSVKGVLLLVGRDNIKVFEYPDAESAAKEIPKNTMKAHIYSAGNLIVFYMGEKKDVLTFLEEYFPPKQS